MAQLLSITGLLPLATLLLLLGPELATAGGSVNYSLSGLDWPSECQTGGRQTPINIVHKKLEKGWKNWSLKFLYEEYTKLSVQNYYRLEVSPPAMSNSLFMPRKNETYQLFNMHSHAFSEHSFDGVFGTMEVHFVHRLLVDGKPAGAGEEGGPLAVVAVVFALDPEDKPNAWLDQMLEFMPAVNDVAYDVELDKPFRLGSLFITKKKQHLDYYTYFGSLTTPGCAEVVTWYILKEFRTMSVLQLEKVFNLTEITTSERTNDRLPQPLNGRVVKLVKANARHSKINL